MATNKGGKPKTLRRIALDRAEKLGTSHFKHMAQRRWENATDADRIEHIRKMVEARKLAPRKPKKKRNKRRK